MATRRKVTRFIPGQATGEFTPADLWVNLVMSDGENTVQIGGIPKSEVKVKDASFIDWYRKDPEHALEMLNKHVQVTVVVPEQGTDKFDKF